MSLCGCHLVQAVFSVDSGQGRDGSCHGLPHIQMDSPDFSLSRGYKTQN